MKTKVELYSLKEEAKKEAKPEGKGGVMLSDEELKQVSGGANKCFLDYNQNAELE